MNETKVKIRKESLGVASSLTQSTCSLKSSNLYKHAFAINPLVRFLNLGRGSTLTSSGKKNNTPW